MQSGGGQKGRLPGSRSGDVRCGNPVGVAGRCERADLRWVMGVASEGWGQEFWGVGEGSRWYGGTLPQIKYRFRKG